VTLGVRFQLGTKRNSRPTSPPNKNGCVFVDDPFPLKPGHGISRATSVSLDNHHSPMKFCFVQYFVSFSVIFDRMKLQAGRLHAGLGRATNDGGSKTGITTSTCRVGNGLAAQTRIVSSKPPSNGTVIVRNRFLGSYTNSKQS